MRLPPFLLEISTLRNRNPFHPSIAFIRCLALMISNTHYEGRHLLKQLLNTLTGVLEEFDYAPDKCI
jgi:hypothetical protein